MLYMLLMSAHDKEDRVFTLEQANQRVTSRASVEPECDRVIRRIIPRLKEPEEGVHVRSKINVSRV